MNKESNSMICSDCGKVLAQSSNFCPNCGASTATSYLGGVSGDSLPAVFLVIQYLLGFTGEAEKGFKPNKRQVAEWALVERYKSTFDKPNAVLEDSCEFEGQVLENWDFGTSYIPDFGQSGTPVNLMIEVSYEVPEGLIPRVLHVVDELEELVVASLNIEGIEISPTAMGLEIDDSDDD